MIRRAGPDDADIVRALRLEALADSPTAYATTFEREAELGDDDWRRRLAIDHNRTILSLDERGANGMVVVVTRTDGPDLAQLFAMWVRPSARGAGVADRLVREVLAFAAERSATVVRLRVTSGNRRAERLYARHGFVRTGRTEVRARDGAVEFEMDVELASVAPPGGRDR